MNNTARLADNGIFIINGASVLLLNDVPGIKLGPLTVLSFFATCAVMVLIMVAGVANGINWLRGMPPIPMGTGFMIFHSGLRGGMTLMMALMIDHYWSEKQNTLENATIVTVILMTYL